MYSEGVTNYNKILDKILKEEVEKAENKSKNTG